MPEISRFFGIIIAMFYNDHPPPHFHVRYGSQRAVIGIADLALMDGEDIVAGQPIRYTQVTGAVLADDE